MSQTGDIQTPLMCGLPDDIAFFCLARVPRKYHAVLNCVSKRWRDLVSSDEWHAYRRKHNLHETWIYALCRDKFEQVCCYVLDPNSSRRHWKRIPGFPPLSLKRKGMGFEALGKKIYLLGGCGWMEDATEEVYCYDASMNSWTEAACLSTPRCYFACEVLDEKIHAIGGLGSKSSTPHSWDYDPYTNSWKCDFDPNIIPEIEDSVVMDGKILIRTNITPVTSRASAVFYEPSSGMWQRIDIDMAVGWQGPAVNVDGTFYVLDQYSKTRLMMWQKEIREWVPVGRLSSLVTRPPCRLVAIGKNIFVTGKGRRTVVIDVGNAGNMEGVMVSTSIPNLTSDDEDDNVMSCKCLAI
ncbi:LOW QUALITY PROTEIN: F-box domain-containing protein/Kelch_1 domain-containing protein, partial [Cephalotus follicularis]